MAATNIIYDLQALKVFLTVAASGSMTEAARRLDLTQSAVSQIVRQIEETLGAVLVDRSQRPLTLTAAGIALQRRAQPLVADAEALAGVVRQAGSSKLPELRIGAIDSFSTTVGPSLIRALLKDVDRLSFRSGLVHDHAEGLLTRNLDLIVSSDAMEDVDGLDRYPLLTEQFVLLLPSKMAASMDNKPDLKALAAGYPLIRFSARSLIGTQIERHLRRLGLKAPWLLEVDATDALMAMVAAGLGWAIATPLCLLQVRAQLNGVRVLPFSNVADTGFTRQLYLLGRSGELGALPARIAQLSREILQRECEPALRKLAPKLEAQFVVNN